MGYLIPQLFAVGGNRAISKILGRNRRHTVPLVQDRNKHIHRCFQSACVLHTGLLNHLFICCSYCTILEPSLVYLIVVSFVLLYIHNVVTDVNCMNNVKSIVRRSCSFVLNYTKCIMKWSSMLSDHVPLFSIIENA
jgi:hypothetical protein